MIDSLKEVLNAQDLVAVLGREVQVRLMDISTSGCLLESESRLEAGTTGTLRVTYGDEQYVDDVRVMRCQSCEGSSGRYHIGATFLWTSSPDERSLRRVLNRLNGAVVKLDDFRRRS